jgi:hypothetical protein
MQPSKPENHLACNLADMFDRQSLVPRTIFSYNYFSFNNLLDTVLLRSKGHEQLGWSMAHL